MFDKWSDGQLRLYIDLMENLVIDYKQAGSAYDKKCECAETILKDLKHERKIRSSSEKISPQKSTNRAVLKPRKRKILKNFEKKC